MLWLVHFYLTYPVLLKHLFEVKIFNENHRESCVELWGWHAISVKKYVFSSENVSTNFSFQWKKSEKVTCIIIKQFVSCVFYMVLGNYCTWCADLRHWGNDWSTIITPTHKNLTEFSCSHPLMTCLQDVSGTWDKERKIGYFNHVNEETHQEEGVIEKQAF